MKDLSTAIVAILCAVLLSLLKTYIVIQLAIYYHLQLLGLQFYQVYGIILISGLVLHRPKLKKDDSKTDVEELIYLQISAAVAYLFGWGIMWIMAQLLVN